jgi:hypothetical protein
LTEKPPYRSISIKAEFADSLEVFIKNNPQYGYRSLAQFLEDASRRRLEELKAEETKFPRMVRVNTSEDGVKIWDNKVRLNADITFTPAGAHCSIDETDDCDHITFALSLPEIKKIVRKRKQEGWKLPDV